MVNMLLRWLSSLVWYVLIFSTAGLQFCLRTILVWRRDLWSDFVGPLLRRRFYLFTYAAKSCRWWLSSAKVNTFRMLCLLACIHAQRCKAINYTVFGEMIFHWKGQAMLSIPGCWIPAYDIGLCSWRLYLGSPAGWLEIVTRISLLVNNKFDDNWWRSSTCIWSFFAFYCI